MGPTDARTLAAGLLLVGCASAPRPIAAELSYVGSSTVGRFVRDAAVVYPAHFAIDTAPESAGGEQAVLESASDLGGVARQPKPAVLATGVEATLIGRDAIAVVVHAGVDVEGVSLAELAGLFTGAITGWAELGGPDLPVHPFVVGEESATRRVFQERVLEGAPYVRCEVVRPDRAILGRVAETPGGVAAISFSFLEDAAGVRPLAVEGETPTVTNFDYPLARPLYLLWRRGDPAVEAFVAWTVGREGQRVLMRHFVGTDVVGSVGAPDEPPPVGYLVVRTETFEVLDGGVPYYPHGPYEVLTRHGEFLRRVRNHRGTNDEQPTRIALEPGVYLVRTRAGGEGTVEFFVTVRAGRTTDLDVLARLDEEGT